jgi:hypothetical protein
MLPHEQPYLFHNTATRLESCADVLENTEWGDLQWNSPDEEKASHSIREWCERYIAAYDDLHGDKPDDE